jgi:hypothetical protein
MPLVGNTTSGAITRTRIAEYIAAKESVTPVVVSDGARTLTAEEIIDKKMFVSQPTAGRAFTTPTGAELLAQLSDEVVGTSFEFTIVNGAAATHAITLTAGASGIVLVGNAVVAAATSGTFLGVVINSTTVAIHRK